MSNLCGARDAAERWNPLRRTVDEWHVECSLVSLRRYTRGPATRPSNQMVTGSVANQHVAGSQTTLENTALRANLVFLALSQSSTGFGSVQLFRAFREQAPIPRRRFHQRVVSSTLVRDHSNHIARAFARRIADKIDGVTRDTGLPLTVRKDHREDGVPHARFPIW